MRLLLAPIFAFALVGAMVPETRFSVTLSLGDAGNAGGRLLLFAEPATAENARSDAVDALGPSDSVAVAARAITDFGPDRRVTIDTQENAFPTGFAALAAGPYRVQVVLDRNGDYAYGGRGPGDLLSKVVTVRFPLTSAPSIALEDAVPPAAHAVAEVYARGEDCNALWRDIANAMYAVARPGGAAAKVSQSKSA
jgi:hypothetical protein